MTCWERTWERVAREQIRRDNERIDREVELLRQTLYSDVRMSPSAMSLILGVQVSQVDTRIAADGHDVEVRFEDGLWRVLDPRTLTVPSLNLGKDHILALNASTMLHNQNRDVLTDLHTTSNPNHHIFRRGVR